MKTVSLESVADGVAKELFERELDRVSSNIADQNTSALAKRTITMTFTFVPDEEREEVKIIVSASSKVAPVKPYAKTAYLGKHNGKATLVQQDQRQLEFQDPNIQSIAPTNGVAHA